MSTQDEISICAEDIRCDKYGYIVDRSGTPLDRKKMYSITLKQKLVETQLRIEFSHEYKRDIFVADYKKIVPHEGVLFSQRYDFHGYHFKNEWVAIGKCTSPHWHSVRRLIKIIHAFCDVNFMRPSPHP